MVRTLWLSRQISCASLASWSTIGVGVSIAQPSSTRLTLVRAAYAEGRNGRSCWLMLDSE